MTQKQKTYLTIGVAVFVLCLLIVAVIHWLKGDTTTAAGATATAMAIASAAAASRQKARGTVEAAKSEGAATGETITQNQNEAKDGMKKVEDDVATSPRDKKEADGEDLLKPGGGS